MSGISRQYKLIPEAGVTMTRTAMFLPASERYSTVACAPTTSLPSTFVLPSTRNWTVFTSLSFVTCTENSASPTDAIGPDSDWLSGAGCRESAAVSAGSGVDHAAMVKQTRNRVARQSEVRNRIEFPPFQFSAGPLLGARNEPELEKIIVILINTCEIKEMR